MYQGGHRAADSDIATVRIVLYVDVPADPPSLARHTIDVIGQYGALIERTIPGAVAGDPVRADSTTDPVTAPVGTGVAMDPRRRQVTIDGRRIRLAHREFDLLNYLDRAGGRTVSRTELLTEVWEADRKDLSERTVDSHVRRLRAKLGDHAGIVSTVRGVGYRATVSVPGESA